MQEQEKVIDVLNFILEKEKDLEKSIEEAKKYWNSWLGAEISKWEEKEKEEKLKFEEYLERVYEEKSKELEKRKEELGRENKLKLEEYRKKLEENFEKALEFLWEKIRG